MIIVRNRELLIPRNEQYIGTTYDESSENRIFLLPRVTQGGVDLSGLVFTLDIEYNTGDTNAVMLTKEIGDEAITLTWPITESQLQVPGTAFINLRAVDNTDGEVKWASFKAAVYIEDTIYTPGHWTGDLTELEQYEAAISLELEQSGLSRSQMDALYQEVQEAYSSGALDGRGIESVTVNADYQLVIVLDDGTTYTSSSIRGPQGVSGVYVGEAPLPEGYNVWIDPDGVTPAPTDGGYYVPSVSEDGTLSWTPTKDGMTNVLPVNIGKAISYIAWIQGDHSVGSLDTYRIYFTDGSTYEYQVRNGVAAAIEDYRDNKRYSKREYVNEEGYLVEEYTEI